jgi:hypothetical protein
MLIGLRGWVCISFFALISLMVQSQENNLEIKRPMNAIGVSVFGDASIISANYERLFYVDTNIVLTGKVGIGFNEEFQLCVFGPCSNPPDRYITMPHHFTANFGKNRHYLELGLGGTPFFQGAFEAYVLYSIIGYRFIPKKRNGLSFRIHFDIPLTGLKKLDIVFVPGGINPGFSF